MNASMLYNPTLIHPNDTEYHTIDSFRTRIEDLPQKVSATIDKILGMKVSEQHHQMIETYLKSKYKTLLSYFKKNPLTFIDLVRKFNKYRKNDRENGWHISHE